MIQAYKGDLTAIPMSTFAFVGDAVYELGIRRFLLERRVMTSGALHHICVKLVRASFQSAFARALQSKLEGDEAEIFRRGRNANPGTPAKHADPIDYRYATALEALFGYLYLQGKTERIVELLKAVFDFAIAADIIS
ncbi:MAG TPA: ribonuclease III [Clostridiaceae bacterium]|nr:ribonuclease III [Clostridiaceae bacterium]